MPDAVVTIAAVLLLPFVAMYEIRKFDRSDRHMHWLRLVGYAEILLWFGFLISIVAEEIGIYVMITALGLVVVGFLARLLTEDRVRW